MKSYLAPLILTFCLFQSTLADENEEFLGLLDPLMAGQPAPNFAFQDPSGHMTDLIDFGGQVLVINFWATWCAPCIEEMPALDTLNQRLIDAGVNARVLAINTDFVPENGPEWLMENKIETLEAFYDATGNAFFDAGGTGMPYTLIVKGDGTIAFEVFGDAPWASDAAFETIRALL